MLPAVEPVSTKTRSCVTVPVRIAVVLNASALPAVFESGLASVAALPSRTVPGGGGGGAAAFEEVTVIDVAVAVLPAASRATAVSAWSPFAVVVESQLIEYGALVSSTPRLAPSSLNWTPATATLSAAPAESATAAPETVAPAAGAVSDTVGAVVSADA